MRRLLELLFRGRRPRGGADVQGSVWDDSSSRYRRGLFKTYWEALPQVSSQQARLMTGGESEDVLSWSVDLIRREVGEGGLRGLSLGCAEAAAPEVAFARSGLFRAIDVMDLAGGLLARQEAAARDHGLDWIRYQRQDLEELRLEPDSYDVIWSIGTVHHVEGLEGLFGEVNRALTDRGLFLMREYVGPDRLQFTDGQLEAANDLLQGLPAALRRGCDGVVKEAVDRVDPDVLIADDPSEAIRSSAILQVMEEALAVDRVVPTGGTLLMPVLDGIAGRLEGSPEADAVLAGLLEHEQCLIATGQLQSDFVFAIARKRPGG